MMNIASIESQVLVDVISAFTLASGVGLSYLTTKAKKLVDAHLSTQQAQRANVVIDGLGTIAEAVVQEFNQRVVAEAKTNGLFTQQLADSVKKDAIAAVMSQGASLIKLGEGAIGDVQALVSSLIERAVSDHKFVQSQTVDAPKSDVTGGQTA